MSSATGHEAVGHDRAIRRFRTAFGPKSDAVLTDDRGVVIATNGSLAAAVASPGLSLAALPRGVASDDLAPSMLSVLSAADLSASAELILADGSTASAQLFSIRSEDATTTYLVMVLSMVVAAAELDRLRQSDQIYGLWFERAPSGVALVSPSGQFLRANPALCRLLDRTEVELQVLTFQQITHPDDLLLDVKNVDDVLAGVFDRYDIDKRYLRPDGSVVWAHLTVALVRDLGGRPVHFIAMVEDISERRRAQDELRAALEFQRTLFDLAPVAMAQLDLAGTIMQVNAAAGELAGGSPDDLLGRNAVDLSSWLDASEMQQSLAALVSGELSRSVEEWRIGDLRGRDRVLSVHVAAVAGLDGAIDSLLMQVLDVTEERDLSNRLHESVESLSMAYREKVALMSALSHDLRTPLATLRILAQLLQRESLSEAERTDIATRLVHEAVRTEGVLSDLVASERAGSGLIAPRRAPVDVSGVVQRVIARYNDPSRSVDLATTATDTTVVADEALLERLIDNLVSNATRHTRVGTQVWVSVDAGIDDVEIVVDDNGVGVPDRLKELVFEPYVRGEHHDRPGSGVGLFLVRQFAQFHGGSAVCLDRPGGGARFHVRIPRG